MIFCLTFITHILGNVNLREEINLKMFKLYIVILKLPKHVLFKHGRRKNIPYFYIFTQSLVYLNVETNPLYKKNMYIYIFIY